MVPGKESVLVVDDDEHMLRLMRRVLELEGYSVATLTNGDSALATLDQTAPDLILLDVMMQGADGFTICRRIREFSRIPIIMVTAKGNNEEKVEGLTAGADDYVTKPFSAHELSARVRAVLRRSLRERPEPTFHCLDLAVDFARHRVEVGQQELKLTATEFRLLAHLARNAGNVLTPDQLLETVWGVGYMGEANLLQVNMTRLRRKLADNPKAPRYIFTKHGVGYTMPRE
ncbi:MAG: response regulator transcription factor [Dehalococcoidia bacterium]|nr:response regulator transcription factor [Dehalococcoidia bacterium]